MTQIQALSNAQAVINYFLTYYPTHINVFESNGITIRASTQEEMTEDEAEKIKEKLEHIVIAGAEIKIYAPSSDAYYCILITWRY